MKTDSTLDQKSMPGGEVDSGGCAPMTGSLAARCSRCMSTATTLFFKRAKIGKKGKEIPLCDICADASRKTLIGGHGYDWRTISPANV